MAFGYKKLQSLTARRMADEKSSIWMIDKCFSGRTMHRHRAFPAPAWRMP
jgi:hypothetical protein